MHDAYPEMLVGAGTVLTTDQVDEAIGPPARSSSSPPAWIPKSSPTARKSACRSSPVCTTPTDYHTAYKFGLEVLKFFPAEQSGGIAKIKAMSAPFPMFKVMPTGRHNLEHRERGAHGLDLGDAAGLLGGEELENLKAELVGGVIIGRGGANRGRSARRLSCSRRRFRDPCRG